MTCRSQLLRSSIVASGVIEVEFAVSVMPNAGFPVVVSLTCLRAACKGLSTKTGRKILWGASLLLYGVMGTMIDIFNSNYARIIFLCVTPRLIVSSFVYLDIDFNSQFTARCPSDYCTCSSAILPSVVAIPRSAIDKNK